MALRKRRLGSLLHVSHVWQWWVKPRGLRGITRGFWGPDSPRRAQNKHRSLNK